MLRRSNSSSHIPVPKNEPRARSKSSVRMSGRETSNCSAKSTIKRGSTDKIPALKRSSSSTTLKKSSLMTPVVQPRTSAKRSTSASNTPSSSSKSPYRFGSGKSPHRFGSGKSDRNFNDKKWVSEQYAKVKYYLQEHTGCQDHIPDTIKPPTINTFVYVMELLLKEIDGRINLTMANYKEVVMSRLKMLRYPGNISNSLLKTVNTMHAWPQVISIFGWLIDLIGIIKRAELPIEPIFESDIKQQKVECVTDYIVNKYILYNSNEDQSIADNAFAENYTRLLNINEEEIEILHKEVTALNNLKEKQMEQIKDVQNKNELLKKEIDELEYEIDTFYVHDELKQDDIDQAIEFLKQRKLRLTKEIKEKQENIKKFNEAIARQPCTYEEKIKLEAHIDQLIHTLDLKKQRLAAKRELKASCDTKLAEARKKVESEVYRLNNELMQLAIVEPELKILQLRENNFMSEDFKDEIKAVVENKKIFERKISDQVESTKAFLSQCKNENEKLQHELDAKKKEIQELIKLEKKAEETIKTYEIKIQTLINDTEDRKKLITEEIRELDGTMPDVASLQHKLAQLQELSANKESDLEKLVRSTEDIFDKLREEIMGHFQKLNVLRNRIFDHMAEKLNDVATEEEKIYNELQQLCSIGDIKKGGE